jgi:predicted SprT family Zn-dependent metalloprotease
MNEQEIIEICKFAKEQIDKHCPEYRLAFNKRKRALGVCDYRKKQIQLSLIHMKIQPLDIMKNTVIHEVAHALTEGHHHDRVWKRKFIELGGDGQRLCTICEMPKGKYTYECPNCKKVSHFYKQVKAERACGECCNTYNAGRFSDKFKLVRK